MITNCFFNFQIIPLRWLPYEAVYEDEYSTKSDVHAFGVLILEIFSQGELPFPKMNDNSFLTKLKEKVLEWKPHKDTPGDLQKLQVNSDIFNKIVAILNIFIFCLGILLGSKSSK